MQNGIEVKYFEGGEEKSSIVYLIDYDSIQKNTFQVINQWTFVENSERRPDVILFINGLPLVVIELKSPSRDETNASEAFRQLKNYMHEIPSLFVYNLACVMSDLTTYRVGTITSDEVHWIGYTKLYRRDSVMI